MKITKTQLKQIIREEKMSNKKVDGTLCFFRHTQGNNTGELVSVAVDIEKEEDRKQFIPLFQRLLKYPEFVRAMEETKGSHSTTSEDSLLRDLKKRSSNSNPSTAEQQKRSEI